eukprot:gene15217-18008_t
MFHVETCLYAAVRGGNLSVAKFVYDGAMDNHRYSQDPFTRVRVASDLLSIAYTCSHLDVFNWLVDDCGHKLIVSTLPADLDVTDTPHDVYIGILRRLLVGDTSSFINLEDDQTLFRSYIINRTLRRAALTSNIKILTWLHSKEVPDIASHVTIDHLLWAFNNSSFDYFQRFNRRYDYNWAQVPCQPSLLYRPLNVKSRCDCDAKFQWASTRLSDVTLRSMFACQSLAYHSLEKGHEALVMWIGSMTPFIDQILSRPRRSYPCTESTDTYSLVSQIMAPLLLQDLILTSGNLVPDSQWIDMLDELDAPFDDRYMSINVDQCVHEAIKNDHLNIIQYFVERHSYSLALVQYRSVCKAYLGEGDDCQGDSKCNYNIGLSCMKNAVGDGLACQFTEYITIGNACSNNASCIGYEGAETVNCIAGTCQILPGQTCETKSHCPFGQYCSMGVCVAEVKIGATCNGDYQCAVGATCSGTKCVAVSSKQLGETCTKSSSDIFDLNGEIPTVECDLSKGLFCDQTTAKCQPFLATPASFNCTSNGNKGDDCPGNESCYCNDGQTNLGSCRSNNIDSSCGDSIQELIKCAVDNKCQAFGEEQYAGDKRSPKNCLYQNCASIMCNNKCSTNMVSKSCSGEPLYPACGAVMSSSIKTVIPSLAIIVLVAILSIVL